MFDSQAFLNKQMAFIARVSHELINIWLEILNQSNTFSIYMLFVTLPPLNHK